MTVKGGEEVLKKLLNKLKNIDAAIVEIIMKKLNGIIEAAEKKKYAIGGVVQPITQRFELDEEEAGGNHEAEIVIPLNNAVEAGKAIKEALIKIGVEAETASEAIIKAAKSLQDELDRINRENTNNWRKMHGLPMRRNAGQRKKHKR